MNWMKLLSIGVLFLMIGACATQKNQTTSTEKVKENPSAYQGADNPPNFYSILEEMDANSDGQISLSEAKGPLAKEFDIIDTDGDGFISYSEYQNAPKPQREKPQGPPGQGGGPGAPPR